MGLRNGWMGGRRDGWAVCEVWLDGWMGVWVDGWVDGWVGGFAKVDNRFGYEKWT